MVSRNKVPEALPKCPECGRDVKFKIDPGESLKVMELDGSPHICPREEEIWRRPRKTAFADALERLNVGFTLRERRLSLTFEDGTILEVYGVGAPPLKLRLITKDGIIEE